MSVTISSALLSNSAPELEKHLRSSLNPDEIDVALYSQPGAPCGAAYFCRSPEKTQLTTQVQDPHTPTPDTGSPERSKFTLLTFEAPLGTEDAG